MTDFSDIDSNESDTEGTNFRPDPPQIVAGRVLYCDADFLAYHCGYRWETESLDKSIEALRLEIQSLRIMAGAEQIELHLTMGDKGGRYEIAKVKEYQGKRSERPEGLDVRVGQLRHYMANCTDPHTIPCAWTDQEADDGLCQRMIQARDNGTENQAVIWSLDKDLLMVPGLHMDGKTYELNHFPNGYGECELDESTSSKKVVGVGHSFFWHQLLMGDTADTIPGLPYLSASIVMNLMPTKKLVAAEARVRKANTPTKMKAARKALNKVLDDVKPKLCGAVSAYKYLEKARTNREAFRLVREAYVEHYGPGSFDFTDWRGETTRETAGSMLVEQARLLWMRRYHGEDVLEFFKEVAE